MREWVLAHNIANLSKTILIILDDNDTNWMAKDIGGGRKFYLGGQSINIGARSAREIFGPRPLN